ncbi:MAG: hypothetical protein BIFFINMI_02016 [Phycisphaerae bacterium]|nr:hypothetical protein [Phycisphaerae bacterium]
MASTRANIDADTTAQDVAAMASADAIAEFFQQRGYDTAKRAAMTTEAVGIADGDGVFRRIELLSEDPEGFLRVVFAQVRSVTAKARNDLVRALGRFSQDHLIILTRDFQVLEFVLIDKVKRHQHGPAAVAAYKPVPKVYSVLRKSPSRLDLRILRRLTFTQRDALDQFDKLRSVFEAAVYTGEYYQNRALFADHYLNTRLQESPAWAESPNAAFAAVRQVMADARERFNGKDEAATREGLVEPLFDALGFKRTQGKAAKDAAATPDYVLKDAKGGKLTAALVYQWDRWLDGPDPADQQTPEENPGASVVSVLERGDADWAIITNGRLWRLYSRRAHSRSTNFYEVDLAEALVETGETDPGEAFRYWWLFFRPQAFAQLAEPQAEAKCWLDTVVAGSRDYAKQVEQRLKRRVFEHIVPHLASGFLADRKGRLDLTKPPTDEELEAIREGCLTLLYRLLFLLYAESRDLLPVRESPYFAASLRKVKAEIADAAGVAESEVDDKLAGTYRKDQARLYDRLADLFTAMDAGDPALNVPTYNGGLFLAKPDKKDDSREARIARFLKAHKVPDLFLAQAIDHLSRDPDEKTFAMVFIDYKSLGVRQLGSIYEGLLEFKLKIAAEPLTTVKEKGAEKVIPLAAAKGKGSRRRAEVAVRKGEVYLANDKSERRASGSYYTPDHIVEYIVENTVGPVLAAKLEALRPALRQAEKDYQRHLANLRAGPGLLGGKWTTKADFEAAAKAEAASRTYDSNAELVDKLFDCKVLDPAMGSGHFLVEAVDFVTDKLLDFLNGFPINPIATALERTRRSILESLADQGVAVDPDKLTDVHLLKRHVLKRCIYGVDLNPMAVELAKVSLWLDAFTLGAPLSFLDHHLRCGNSLIGATFAQLDEAVHDQLFRIDYAPMLRAIGNVLTVASMADATAAEVHRSADLYANARRELSGYQVILDILIAPHFGVPGALTLLQHASDLDLTSRESLFKSLRPIDRKMVDAAIAAADQRRFFHWELEFPECFFGLRPGTQRQIEHRPPAQAGFDAVVGNPPYLGVRTGTMDVEFSGYARITFEAAARNWDIFAVFLERFEQSDACPFALGMIVPTRVSTNHDFLSLRERFFDAAGPSEVLDCGAPFDDPTVAASIVIHRHDSRNSDVGMGVFDATGKSKFKSLPIALLRVLPDRPFITPLQPDDVTRFQRIIEAPRRLSDYLEITRGMECGRNDDNVLDTPARGAVPVLSGEGVREFQIVPQGLFIPLNLEPIARYKPAALFRTVPKLLLRFVAPHPVAAVDFKGYANFNTVYNGHPPRCREEMCFALAALLNSPLVRWWFRNAYNSDETLYPHIQKYQLDSIPMPELHPDDAVMRELIACGRNLTETPTAADPAVLNDLAIRAYGLA